MEQKHDIRYVKERDLKSFAREAAETIVIRTYTNGNSDDTERKTSEIEQIIISNLIFAGLLAIKNGGDVQTAKDACEYAGKLFLPDMNGYDSIYLKIDSIMERA